MSVSFIVDGDAFRPALPRKLAEFPAPPHSFVYAVAPDGERLLSYKDLAVDAAGRREPVVVINWFDELEAKVPK